MSIPPPDAHTEELENNSSTEFEITHEDSMPTDVQASTHAVRSGMTAQLHHPIVTPVFASLTDFATSEYCELSWDHSSVPKTLESMFRNTLLGIVGVLETMGRHGTLAAPNLNHALPAFSRLSTSDAQPDSSHMNELQDEIEELKRQMRETTEWKLEKELEAKRLYSEIEHLRRKIVCLETQATCTDVEKPVQRPVDSCGALTPTASNHICGNQPFPSGNPLSHLLTLDFEPDLEPNNIQPSTPSSPQSAELSSSIDPQIAASPPLPNSVPQCINLLPIKSQRKRHLLFPDHQN